MTNSKRAFVIFLTAGLSSFATAAYVTEIESPEAESPELSNRPSFETVDSNLDGVITPEEAKGSWLASVFADVDTNQDGLVNRNEYETAMT